MMTDRERVLMNIAVDTAGSVHNTMQSLDGGWCLRFTFGRPAAQFIPEELGEKIGMPMKPGDVVRCNSNPNHHWGIAELVNRLEYSCFMLREIGGDKLCRMQNERVDVLRFMQPDRLYTGTKHRIYRWAVDSVFLPRYNPDADRNKRCGGVVIEDDTLTIWCRPHIFWMEKRFKEEPTLYAQPKKFTMQWSDKTRLKDIVAAIREQGFAGEFDYGPDEPTEGQAGYAKFTPDDILRSVQTCARKLV